MIPSNADAWATSWKSADPARRAAFLRIGPDRVERATGRRVVGAPLSLENRVFELEGGTIVKVYRPDRWSADALDEEHRFLDELDGAGVPVARVLDRMEIDGCHAALFPKLEGDAPTQDLDDAALREIGALAARIHEVGARASLRHRPVIEPVGFGLGNLRTLVEADAIHVDVRAAYVARVEEIVREGAPRFEGAPLVRIHSDFDLQNCLATPRGIAVLDFDDLTMGPAVQDVWLVPRPLRTRPSLEESARRLALLLEGYCSVRPFDDRWLDLVPTLRALRAVWMNAWIASRRFDPLFVETYPTFETGDYWRTELTKLA